MSHIKPFNTFLRTAFCTLIPTLQSFKKLRRTIIFSSLVHLRCIIVNRSTHWCYGTHITITYNATLAYVFSAWAFHHFQQTVLVYKGIRFENWIKMQFNYLVGALLICVMQMPLVMIIEKQIMNAMHLDFPNKLREGVDAMCLMCE